MRIGAVDNEKHGKGEANCKPKEQRGGFHGALPAFGMAHLNISGGKESRFFGSRPWMANANAVPANQKTADA